MDVLAPSGPTSWKDNLPGTVEPILFPWTRSNRWANGELLAIDTRRDTAKMMIWLAEAWHDARRRLKVTGGQGPQSSAKHGIGDGR